jgi:SAM-dependent methyltransferase
LPFTLRLFPAVSNQFPDPLAMQTAVLAGLNARTTHRGEVLLPCIPAALEHYLQHIEQIFDHAGRPLSAEEQQQVRELVGQTLAQGFAASPSAMMLLKYEVVGVANLQKELSCSVAIAIPSLAEQYQQWSGMGDSPLFGQHPDAKVMDLLPELGEPATAPVLDLGSGPGRNALPIARLGFPVEALELTPEFATQLRQTADAENLPVTVRQTDLFDPLIQLKSEHYQLALLSEVVPHFRQVEQLRQMLRILSEALRPDGLLLFNIFLAIDDYQPTAMAREMAQVAWSSLFTPLELATALEGLPLKLISNESVYDYEKAHLPESTFPPTPWFEDWASGRSAFPLTTATPPLELRWLLYQRI